MLSHGKRFFANELYLRQELRKVRLIGELPLDRADRDYLESQIRSLVDAEGTRQATQRLENSFGASLASFMVLQGIYGYHGGDYWTDLCQCVPIPMDVARQWGDIFHKVLATLQLPTFEEAGESAALTAILAHGGIPDDSLPDFFQKVLAPALTEPRYAGFDAADLLEVMGTRSGEGLARPVMRSLLHGGVFARDFVERCLDMARDGLVGGLRSSAQDLGLPERVVSAFHEWIHQPGRARVPTAPPEVRRRPVLMLHPMGDGVCLFLPAQDLRGPCRQVAWVVTAPAFTRRLRMHFDPEPDGFHVESGTLPVERPADRLDVVLEVDGQARGSWEVSLGLDGRPFLLFEAGTGRRLPGPPPHAEDGVWMVYRASLELEWSNGRPCSWLETFDLLPGWDGYSCRHLSCGGGGMLRLRETGTARRSFEVDLGVTRESTLRFVGGHPLPPGVESDVRAWIGAPPELLLPDGSQEATLCIQPEGSASPAEVRLVRIQDLPAQACAEGLHLPLGHPLLLGPSPVGTFRLTLRGFLGQDARASLRILPSLAVQRTRSSGNDPGGDTVTLLDLPAEVETTQLGAGGWESLSRRPDGRFEIIFAPGRSEAEVRCEWTLPCGTSVPVPVRVRRELWRWRLVGTPQDEAGWQQRPIAGSLEELLEDSAPSLVVDVSPLGRRPLEASLTLAGADGRPVMEPLVIRAGGGTAAATPLAPRVRFDLAPHGDALRACLSSLVGVLSVEPLGSARTEGCTETVLVLDQPWRVREVRATAQEAGAEADRSVLVRWKAPHQVHHRGMRLWSLWRPWEPPQACAIPDEAEDGHLFTFPRESLPPGHYRVDLGLDEPWSTSSFARPASDSASSATLQVGTPEELEAHVQALPETGLACAERYLAALHMEGPCRISTLYPLRESISDKDVPALLDLRLAVADLPDPHRPEVAQLEAFTRQFIPGEHGPALCRAMCDRARSGGRAARQALVDECVRLGLVFLPAFRACRACVEPEVREALWSLWPPLGAVLVPHDWDAAEPELAHRLGHAAIRELGEWEAGSYDLFGRCQRPEVPLDAGIIGSIMGSLPAPDEPLHRDSDARATLDWLLRAAKEGPRESARWAGVEHAYLQARLDDAAKKGWLCDGFVKELAKRQPHLGFGEHSWVPYCVGAVALLCVTLARGEERRAALHVTEDDLRRNLVLAHRIAPELLAHDLCLAEALMRMEKSAATREAVA